MMHHPNMHHQPMSGHPPQHLAGHQGIPAHHQMPPHQMHRDNRVTMGPTGNNGGMGQPMNMNSMGVPHHATQRPPHGIRPMHHPPAQHHSMPPQGMKHMRRPYSMGGGYPNAGPNIQYNNQYQPPPQPQPTTTVDRTSAPTKVSANVACVPAETRAESEAAPSEGGTGEARGEGEAPRPAPTALANSKEKTPMCLVNELARYNKIKHQYRLTSETGPAHKKVFTVTLRLGDNEEYTAEGSSIKRAQHAAASAALTQTRFPPPPPGHQHSHPPSHHHRHTGTVMPTVELNALAMKLCQPAIYTTIPAVTAPTRAPRVGMPYRIPAPCFGQRIATPGLIYRVRVVVGGKAWLGEGSTPQAARHDAAARALQDLRPPSEQAVAQADEADGGESEARNEDLLNEVKSPVSLVHELALKRNLTVVFSVKSERGPPHMRVFITLCTVGELETEGEGNGKKVSKRRAAEKMLEEMRRRWPPAILRARPPPPPKRKQQPTKKKPKNLIKENGETPADGARSTSPNAPEGSSLNPISRLAMARHAARARSPQYRVLEERGAARRREFLVECDAPPHSATGLGPNKKTAKRRAAQNVLLAMELGNDPAANSTVPSTNGDANTSDAAKSANDTKRKEGDVTGNAGEVRQPVPGVIMMDYQQRSGQPPAPNGVSETSAVTANGSSPGAKEQLLYLSQLLGFTVQFSDFPKRNHGEYLSLVSLSTSPPVMCHGAGASTALSHEQCARAALRALTLMGLDAPAPTSNETSVECNTISSPTSKGVLSNGVTE